MSLDDIPGAEEDLVSQHRNITIGELEMIYGTEPVRRALQYMTGLQEADREYRQSADPEDLDKGLENAYDIEDVETEASDKWAERMKEKGLGIDE